jgi:hypothetical protein
MSRVLPSSRRRCRPTAPPPSSCVPSASHSRATAHAPFLDPIGSSRATCCLGRALVVTRAEPPRPPVLAVRPHWRVLRPNSGHPQDLGEHMVVPHCFPDRERGRLTGIRLTPLLTVQNRVQVHRKPMGDLVPFSPRRVLPRFVNPRIRSKLLGFSI